MHGSKRRSTLRLAVVLSMILGAFALMPARPGGLIGPERATAAVWIGSTQGKLSRSTKWVSAGATLRGDFWFRVDRQGRVSGHAVVVYEPTFDTARLNALLSYAKSLVGVPLGAIPLLGGFASSQLALIVDVRVNYNEQMPIREGRITGTLRRGRLEIRWAGGDPPGLRFNAVLTTLEDDQPLTSGSIRAASPWPRAARVRAGRLAISTARSGSVANGVTEKVTSYWSARRVAGN